MECVTSEREKRRLRCFCCADCRFGADRVARPTCFPRPSSATIRFRRCKRRVRRGDRRGHEYLDLAFLTAALAAASLSCGERPVANGPVPAFHRLRWPGSGSGGKAASARSARSRTSRRPLFDKRLRGGRDGDCRLRRCRWSLRSFSGRSFCASVCPLGAVQELVAVRPVQVPTWIDHALGLLAYVYLGAAVLFAATGTAWIICRYDPFVGLFRLSSSASHAGPQRGVPGRRAVHRPALLPLALSLRGDPCAALAAVLAAPADSARAVRAVPAVRRCLPLRGHPAADRRALRPSSAWRPGGG